MRVAADFDNFRKRARRETEEAAHKSGQNVLRAILPIIDNLERAVDNQASNPDPAATLEGVRMVLKQLQSELRQRAIQNTARARAAANAGVDACTGRDACGACPKCFTQVVSSCEAALAQVAVPGAGDALKRRKGGAVAVGGP